MTTVYSRTDRSAQLYSAAVELFITRGYREVDVTEIAGAAGTSHGTFYNYFRNKRDLLVAVQESAEVAVLAAVSASDDGRQPESRDGFISEFGARITRAVSYFVAHPQFTAFVILSASGVDDDAFAKTISGYQRAAAQFTELLRYGRRHSWVQSDLDLDIAGQAIVSAILMTVLPALLGETTDVDADVASRLCAEFLLQGTRGLSGPC